MPKFVSRATFVAVGVYAGALFQTHRGQLWDALKTALGLTDVNRTTVTATSALTTDQCGILEVDATAGNMVLTLPASGAATDEAKYEVHRLDATANTVTFAGAGADTIDGAYTVGPIGRLTLKLPAGRTVWRSSGIGGATAAAARQAVAGAAQALRVDVASVAGTVDLTANAPNTDNIRLTGSFDITKFTIAAGRVVHFVVSGSPSFADNANIINQRGALLRLWPGDSGVLRATAADTVEVISLNLIPGVMHVRDEKSSGTQGGSSVSGDQVRTLNTVVRNTIQGASLTANQITLPAGRYRIFGVAPCYAPDFTRVRLVNVTDAAILLLGTNSFVGSAVGVTAQAFINGSFMLTGTKVINLTHYILQAQPTLGLGRVANDGNTEVYAEVFIERET